MQSKFAVLSEVKSAAWAERQTSLFQWSTLYVLRGKEWSIFWCSETYNKIIPTIVFYNGNVFKNTRNVRITSHGGPLHCCRKTISILSAWLYSCLNYPACKSHLFLGHSVFSSVAWLAVPYFPHYLINGTIFENKLLNIICVFWFSIYLLSDHFSL